MIIKVKAELLHLTHELAVQFNTMPPVPGERDKRPSRLNFFKRHLKNGTFGSPTWSVAIVKGAIEEMRADGQHTSTVLAGLPPEQFPQGLQVTKQTFQIDSVEEDAQPLFDMFDNPQSARTHTDAMSIYRAQWGDLKGLKNAFLVDVAKGIDYYLEEFPLDPNYPKVQWARRKFGMYYTTPKHRDFANWLHQWEDARHAWMIGKGELTAEMFHDWNAFPNIATIFWGYVLKEDHPDSADETRELAATLKDLAGRKKDLKKDAFRKQARKFWDRYRRFMAAKREESTEAEPEPATEPPAPEPRVHLIGGKIPVGPLALPPEPPAPSA